MKSSNKNVSLKYTLYYYSTLTVNQEHFLFKYRLYMC